ncbi:alpha/beta fold hydrolase [Lentzea cavernae]|uniref:Peroxidase n=1 Tax=Lentzea cavernae TaxID=2020703 RepID=A0ABQ3M5M7_9PSEU|nr:alpha/beta hydrolase [Lentzea cavernae]GHH29810.1 peroxidase [Lentzea cavernae]
MSANTAVTRTVDVDGTPFAYRETGLTEGVPLVLLHHFTAVLDDWDPAVVDGLAGRHRVVLVDLRGVGGSGGTTPDTVEAMATDLAAFVRALGFDQVDLLGVSMGGMIAQVLAQREPGLVRRMVLAGTSPAGDEGPANALALLQNALQQSAAEGKHPKHVLFFSPTASSQGAADAFLARLNERTEDRDAEVTNETIGAQAAALANWELKSSPEGLANVRQPVLVVNGDNDVMTPTISSFNLARYLPNAQLSIYPDAGHGALFQHHELFVEQALEFLNA